MYEQFFGLGERPFELSPDPRFLVWTAAHREALSNLQYGISARKGIILLLGEAGTGKTTIIRTALSQLPATVHHVHLNNPALTRPEFVEMLGDRFGLSPAARLSKARLLVELEALLRTRYAAGEFTTLIVDEAQGLSVELLEELRLFANVETDSAKLLTVVIAGQPELAERLDAPELRQFKQRIALRCELQPLTFAECAGYIAGRLKTVGGVGAQIFTREAVMLIHEHSGGIPRLVNILADNALLNAFALGVRPVTRQVVQDVCDDFATTPKPAAQVETPRPVPQVDTVAAGPFNLPPSSARTDANESGLTQLRISQIRSPIEEPPTSPSVPTAPATPEPAFLSRLMPRRRFSFFSRGRAL